MGVIEKVELEEYQKTTQKQNVAASNSANTQAAGLKWDMNFVDILLYLVTPIILVLLAVLLLFASPSQSAGATKTDARCYFPKEFIRSWTEYGRRYCASGHAGLYIPITGEARPIPTISPNNSGYIEPIAEYEQVEAKTVFPRKQTTLRDLFPKKEATFEKLALLAIVCLAPLVIWRLVIGQFDGSEFISNTASEPNGLIKILSLVLWFVITKIGSIVICALLIVHVLALQADNTVTSTLSSALVPDTESAVVLCDFWIRRLGMNIHRYTAQCLLTREPVLESSNNYYYIMEPLLKSLLVWVYGLTIVVAINFICTLVLSLMCLLKSYRIYFIKSKVGKQEVKKYSAVDYGLGISGVMVATLATRNGRGAQVSVLLRQLFDDLHGNEIMKQESIANVQLL